MVLLLRTSLVARYVLAIYGKPKLFATSFLEKKRYNDIPLKPYYLLAKLKPAPLSLLLYSTRILEYHLPSPISNNVRNKQLRY